MNWIWPGGSFKAERKEGQREKGGSVGHVFHRWVCEKWELKGLVDGGGDKTPAPKGESTKESASKERLVWVFQTPCFFGGGRACLRGLCVSKRYKCGPVRRRHLEFTIWFSKDATQTAADGTT